MELGPQAIPTWKVNNFTWSALYPNGEVVEQFDDAGVEKSPSELRDDITFIFRLVGVRTINIEIKPNTKLIYAKKHVVTPEGEEVITIAGFQWRETGKYKLAHIHNDGRIVESDTL